MYKTCGSVSWINAIVCSNLWWRKWARVSRNLCLNCWGVTHMETFRSGAGTVIPQPFFCWAVTSLEQTHRHAHTDMHTQGCSTEKLTLHPEILLLTAAVKTVLIHAVSWEKETGWRKLQQADSRKKHEDKREQTTGFPSQNFFLGSDLPSCVCVATSSTW